MVHKSRSVHISKFMVCCITILAQALLGIGTYVAGATGSAMIPRVLS